MPTDDLTEIGKLSTDELLDVCEPFLVQIMKTGQSGVWAYSNIEVDGQEIDPYIRTGSDVALEGAAAYRQALQRLYVKVREHMNSLPKAE